MLRHGHTEANEKKLYCGQTDLPLSENGIKEIESLKNQNIYPEKPDIFFTSGLLRTLQTIDIIYGADVKSTAEPLISEYKFGRFEMKSYEELKENADYQAWIMDDAGNVECPGGESKNQFNDRIKTGFANILREIRNASVYSAMISCHGGVIVSIMELLNPHTKNFYEWQPKPGRGYTLYYDYGKMKVNNRDNRENSLIIREGFMSYKNI
jgi:alpha-ribazole phosphatase